jgi:hypothetical protein
LKMVVLKYYLIEKWELKAIDLWIKAKKCGVFIIEAINTEENNEINTGI